MQRAPGRPNHQNLILRITRVGACMGVPG